ncbi:MAG: MFS transporter [Syntrophobacteraceae bacterium]
MRALVGVSGEIGDRRSVIAWAMYDWANSAFATTVIAGFFPVFFKQYWSAGADASISTFHLGAANSLASVFVAAMAPALGAIADRGGAKKKFLFFFAMMGIVMTGALFFVAEGAWEIAVATYAIAAIGFSGGNIFYDSLLMDVVGKDKVDFVSALGYALGYLGGGLLFAVNVAMTLAPHAFGLPDAGCAVRVSFVSVAVWWAVFSLPVLLFVKEKGTGAVSGGVSHTVADGLRQVLETFRKIRKLRVVFLFLLAYWLYIDGVDTIIRMAVDYGMSIGLDSTSLIKALLITQFVGFPSAIAFGKIGERLGAKTGIYIGVAVYLGVTVWGFFMHSEKEFYAMAITIGMVQGGVQSLSRSFYTRLIPSGQAAEFFGFFNMLGKFAAVLGPVLMGWVGLLAGNPRFSIFAISFLFIIGAALLIFVDEEQGRRLLEDAKSTDVI